MLNRNKKQLMLGFMAAAAITSSSLSSHADGTGTTNINLAVASNFYGSPQDSAITDIINAFESANSNYTVTVTDNGAQQLLKAISLTATNTR
jgi:ABC-type glycerol-3-phosphate transport system substrate-binding protein